MTKKVFVVIIFMLILGILFVGCPELSGGVIPPVEVGKKYHFRLTGDASFTGREGTVVSFRNRWIVLDNGLIINTDQIRYIEPK